ncbi:26.5 kDa heat shock protein, mitochondrial isoform X2 [Ipomoea triloba]|uniref:26.5 kDa heat shock protein, mitochondrial isoform X2 n=1 Tax=Ipomoea triloba TaxID=35885 RepID=UPI00125D69D6|nr:26.5 kDa heat shock protein, mitochondrial isoform X2 [Ipomoea triloba]
MALGRLVLKNLQEKIASKSSHLLSPENTKWGSQLLRRLSTAEPTAAGAAKSEVAVSDAGKKSKLFPRRRRRGGLWTRNDRDFTPSIWGFGNALFQATENMNRLFDRLSLINPTQLMGRYKEDDKCYKIRYDVPGLRKEDLKITAEDGYLTIKGEHKEEEEGGDEDDELWSSRRYGFYDASVMLPDDAKADEIKAEMKNGVLTITIPRTEQPKKNVKEIQVM